MANGDYNGQLSRETNDSASLRDILVTAIQSTEDTSPSLSGNKSNT